MPRKESKTLPRAKEKNLRLYLMPKKESKTLPHAKERI